MNKLNMYELTAKEIRQIESLIKSRGDKEKGHPYQVGQNYFIRTVTHYYTGRLVRVTQKELVLEDAAWIADTGRFHDALKNGTLSEIEPFPSPVIVGRGAVIDATLWTHELPRNQK